MDIYLNLFNPTEIRNWKIKSKHYSFPVSQWWDMFLKKLKN